MSWYTKALKKIAYEVQYLDWFFDYEYFLFLFKKWNVSVPVEDDSRIYDLDGKTFELEWSVKDNGPYDTEEFDFEQPDEIPDDLWTNYLASVAQKVIENNYYGTAIVPESKPKPKPEPEPEPEISEEEALIQSLMGEENSDWSL